MPYWRKRIRRQSPRAPRPDVPPTPRKGEPGGPAGRGAFAGFPAPSGCPIRICPDIRKMGFLGRVAPIGIRARAVSASTTSCGFADTRCRMVSGHENAPHVQRLDGQRGGRYASQYSLPSRDRQVRRFFSAIMHACARSAGPESRQRGSYSYAPNPGLRRGDIVSARAAIRPVGMP